MTNDNIQVFHLSITVVWSFLNRPHYWLRNNHILKEASFTHTHKHICLCVCVWERVYITSSMRKHTQNFLQKIYRQATTLSQPQALETLATQCQELSTEIAFDEIPQIAYWTSWTWEIPLGQNNCDKNYLKKSYKDLTHYNLSFTNALETQLLFPPSPPTELPPPDEVRPWIVRHWRICKGKSTCI